MIAVDIKFTNEEAIELPVDWLEIEWDYINWYFWGGAAQQQPLSISFW